MLGHRKTFPTLGCTHLRGDGAPGFSFGLSDPSDFGGRSDQRTNFRARPSVESGDRIEREAAGQPKGWPLGTHTRKLGERFWRTGNVVGISYVLSGFDASKHTVRDRGLGVCGIHHRPRGKPVACRQRKETFHQWFSKWAFTYCFSPRNVPLGH
jgi:hypothetical protein